MNGPSARRRERPSTAGSDVGGLMMLAAAVTVLVAGGATAGAVHLSNALSEFPQELPGNPFPLVLELGWGRLVWPAAATWLVVTAAFVIGGLMGIAALLVRRDRSRRTRVDAAASRMGRGRDLAALGRKGATATAARLRVPSPGLPIGERVAGRQVLFSSWEDVSVDIWGRGQARRRHGRSRRFWLLRGPVLATSNKRDLLHATRDLRAAEGPVWVFRPPGDR